MEILFAIIMDGSNLDPHQAYVMDAFRTVKRILIKNPQLKSLFEKVWNLERNRLPSQRARGPVGRLHRIIDRWGWDWAEPWAFTRPGLPPLPVLPDALGWWKDQLRHTNRCHQWSRLRLAGGQWGREDMAGLTEVDPTATMALLWDKVPQDQRLMRPPSASSSGS